MRPLWRCAGTRLEHLRSDDRYTLLQLTDLHISRLFTAKWARAVVERANGLGANLIVVTGDLIDGSLAARGRGAVARPARCGRRVRQAAHIDRPCMIGISARLQVSGSGYRAAGWRGTRSRVPDRPEGQPNASFRQCTRRRCGWVRSACRETPCCPPAKNLTLTRVIAVELRSN